MVIQRDEAFEKAYSEICKPIIARPYPRNEKGEYIYKEIREAYLMWKAAKAQVPEGFVLVPKEPTDEMLKISWDNLDSGDSDEFWCVFREVLKSQEQAND